MVKGFTLPRLEKLAPLFRAIRGKMKTNRGTLAHDFKRFASATGIYFEF